MTRALRWRAMPVELRHWLWFERAHSYYECHQLAAAKKDLGRIVAEDASYPGAAAKLAGLSG